MVKDNNIIDVFFLYVGNHEVETVHKTTHTLDESFTLRKGHIVDLFRKHRTLNNSRYKLISLLRFNITVDEEELLVMNEGDTNKFLRVDRHIDDMNFADTTDALQHVNSVFFVFSRDLAKPSKSSFTRRIIFNDKYRKTRRGRKQT